MPAVPTLIPSRITQLPVATELSPTVLVPVVQDGVTKQAALSLFPAQAAAAQFFMDTVADGTFALMSSARYPFSVNGVYGLKTSSGTVTASLQINGVAITGLNAIAVTSVAQTVLATALSELEVGDRLTLVLTGNAAGIGLEFTIDAERE